jgi:FtsP/CotA-like multicopper oxidase with cupredoxin domain
MSEKQNSNNSDKLNRRDFFRKGFQKTASVVNTTEVGVNGAPKKKVLGHRTAMSRRNFVKIASVATVAAGVVLAVGLPKIGSDKKDTTLNYKGKVTPEDRKLAASSKPGIIRATVVAAPGGTPDYFGTTPNYANSPQPTITAGTPSTSIILTGFALQNGGSGYTTPVILIIGGGGTGATAVAHVSNGIIKSIALTYPGTGYTTTPTVSIRDPSPNAKGALATATLTTTVSTISTTGGIRKFVDSLPGLGSGAQNNLGQYIPVAVPDTTTFPGSDYYEIELREYTEKMHTDLPSTRLRGYVQVPTGTGLTGTATPVAPIHYLGPIIVAHSDRPVRVKFTNKLPTGTAGNLFIPVDTTYMGAGAGPNGGNYTQNRATLHLHGGNTIWISDGTPHQWTAPVGETTAYPKGVSVHYIPDMWFVNGVVVPNTVGQTTPPVGGATNNPGAGSLTFFYSNQQTARLMFYHDHAYGITRLNVYAGEAAGYVLTDQYEQDLINGTNIGGANPTNLALLPGIGIPIVIQDKSFVDAPRIPTQDPTWNWGTTTPTPHTGDLWFPHVYMPNQNPYDITGANPCGRWDYGPWFWPPFTGLQFGPVSNPYYDPLNPTLEPPVIPGVPNPSGTPESFMDTPLVNGTAYPKLNVQPQVYRFRILNACNDRMLNLQLYMATGILNNIAINGGGSGYASTPSVTITGGGGTGALAVATVGTGASAGTITAITVTNVGSGYTTAPTITIAAPTGLGGVRATATATIYTNLTPLSGMSEVGMLPADSAGNWPEDVAGLDSHYPIPDGRAGGFPDPALRGPAIIQIGTEGGFLSAPTVIANRPVGYDYNRRSVTVLNVLEHALFMAPAERADVIIDFTNFAGKTLILYNDSPAPVPGFDPRIDYFTADGDQTLTGGAFNTIPGYGPNTRTIMQINVATGASSTVPPNDYNPTLLTNLQTALRATFAASQDPIIVPQSAYNAVYNGTFPGNISAYVAIQDTTHVFTPLGQTTPITMPIQPKGIQELFTLDYGRMNALLSYEIPNTTGTTQTTIIQAYIDPPNEVIANSNRATPIGTLGDGTQIWKFTHNGVDTHVMHFHLFNVQVVNRVGWDGAIRPLEANELGWKESVRMHPLEDCIIALRPFAANNHPFKIPNSVRLLDPTRPLGSIMDFTNVDPLGNPVTVTNQMCNFGWEYVDHCHILGHEENDMMRPMAFGVAPEAPTNLIRIGGGINVVLNWVNNSLNATSNTIQRADNPGFTTNVQNFVVASNAASYTDTTAGGTTRYYRVIASNTVGLALGAYPTMTIDSQPSNTRQVN